jgi:hypothetical protein
MIYRKDSGTNQARAHPRPGRRPDISHPAPDLISCYGMIFQACEGRQKSHIFQKIVLAPTPLASTPSPRSPPILPPFAPPPPPAVNHPPRLPSTPPPIFPAGPHPQAPSSASAVEDGLYGAKRLRPKGRKPTAGRFRPRNIPRSQNNFPELPSFTQLVIFR